MYFIIAFYSIDLTVKWFFSCSKTLGKDSGSPKANIVFTPNTQGLLKSNKIAVYLKKLQRK